jgi:ABC-2 type transport system ATP-binding protein
VSDVVLRTRGLVKRFGSLTAVDHLDIDVTRGEVVGLPGPNGAGKSTTIGMILGLILPTAGTAEVMGRDVWRDQKNALAASGAIVETPAFSIPISRGDNLMALAIIRGGASRTRVDPLLERVGLTARAASKYRTYSRG